jgi:phenylalanyl-tRNA synthetase beta chain
MKISLNSLVRLNQQYAGGANPLQDGIDALAAKIGSQLGGIEEILPIGHKYDGVVIVRVVTCEQHPNADRLHVCMIDDGGVTAGVARDDNGLVQVVCGAPNVTTDATVAWLPPGATVPSSYGSDPFVLEARELRGVVSNGMLASPKELGLGDSHEGLLLFEDDESAIAPGTMFADRYGLRGDVVVDIENKMFTHRPDCFGWLGVAREIAGIQRQAFTSPDWYRSNADTPQPVEPALPLEVHNELPDLVPRFTAVTMSGVHIGPSPVWLQVELSRVGLRPINNIVDLTNYYMLLTGQPLHAYDYDKVLAGDAGAAHATLVVRGPQTDEKLTLLNGKEITPRPEAILIASATQAIGLGGVMGGASTEVDSTTRNIILECASFNMYSIRRTSMAHGLFSDAVTRFTKGQSPLQNRAVLAKIIDDIMRICGGQVASSVIDDNHVAPEAIERNALYPDVTVSAEFINDRLGLDLTSDDMARLLTNVEFAVRIEGENLAVRAPFWRTDIEIAEDIVEEVGRIYGYDKLPLVLPKRAIMPAVRDEMLETKTHIRQLLSRAGASEVLSYSFVHGNLLDKVTQDKTMAYKLSNALSPDLQYYRLSLTPSLLDKVNANIKAGYDAFALFEIGKVHSRTETDAYGLPQEFGRLSLVFAADAKRAASAYAGSAYYQARKYLMTLFDQTSLRFVPLSEIAADHADYADHKLFQQMIAPFDMQRSALVYAGTDLVGVVGEYKTSVHKAMKLPVFCAGFEIFLSALRQTNAPPYVGLPRFPKVTQDITLRVAASVSYGQLYDAVWKVLRPKDTDDILASLTPLGIYQPPESVEYKNITLRYVVASYKKTMTDSEVSDMLDRAAQVAGQQFAAERI